MSDAVKIPEWRRCEPTVMSGLFVLHDMRSREVPFALMIDAIDTGKHADRMLEPTIRSAQWNVRDAARFLDDAANAVEANMIHLSMAALHCLFAMRCLQRQTPIMALVDVPADLSRPRQLLTEASQCKSEADILRNIVTALSLIGELFLDDDGVQKNMRQLRSLAWSSYVPGIIWYADVVAPNPKE